MNPEKARLNQENARKEAETQTSNRQMSWLTVLLGLVILAWIIHLLGGSFQAIAIVSLIVLIVALILDWIEKTKQRAEADDRAAQIHDLSGK